MSRRARFCSEGGILPGVVGYEMALPPATTSSSRETGVHDALAEASDSWDAAPTRRPARTRAVAEYANAWPQSVEADRTPRCTVQQVLRRVPRPAAGRRGQQRSGVVERRYVACGP